MVMSFLLVATLLCSHAFSHEPAVELYQAEKSSCSWECMRFTLMWPGAFCVGLRKPSGCNIPLYIQGWTIHGLWPMHTGHCCQCWPIFPSDLEELEPELFHLWPTLLKTTSNFTFWRNEWIKHGSCAACVEGMNSPTRYFKLSLSLRGRFDIDQALMDAGIKPSCNHTYQFANLYSALAPTMGDKIEIQCLTDDQEREVFTQVKIPLFKNLTLGCVDHGEGQAADTQALWHTSPGHPCRRNNPVFYFPINRENPHQPCD
ncbi:ribonuclease T2-like [Megalops cyprinoides]|uniref:ribonuclease T2-like n=1 Tax=Megalops cyprinoides TaxID=118141 RepID=UPI00186436C7|nr:ribonuclease T2-like [Megalops cyprinoides]